MSQFNSKDDAKAKVEKLRDKVFKKFCPLLRTRCNNGCVCFEDASMTPVARSNMPAPPIYEVHPKRCTNSMFSKGEDHG